jgi:hypothetical protein
LQRWLRITLLQCSMYSVREGLLYGEAPVKSSEQSL